jgi:hypothetical protein
LKVEENPDVEPDYNAKELDDEQREIYRTKITERKQ